MTASANPKALVERLKALRSNRSGIKSTDFEYRGGFEAAKDQAISIIVAALAAAPVPPATDPSCVYCGHPWRLHGISRGWCSALNCSCHEKQAVIADAPSGGDSGQSEAERVAKFAHLFQAAARDESLSDLEARNVVRFLSLRPVSEADIARTKELADKYGWEGKYGG